MPAEYSTSERASYSGHFPDADGMPLGVYYYPEAWPEAQWARDLANIKKLGLQFVHLGEFAWTFIEPEEGRFDFSWIDRAVQLAHEESLKVVLCTPTAAPPIWLTEKHPEVLMVDAAGRRQQHGSRQHACWSVEVYRDHVATLGHELGKHYGSDTRVWGWQIDNELSHYGKEPCYCGTCQAKFRAWLKSKYTTIAALNRDWGTHFWSQHYHDFEQILLPNTQLLPAQSNPHAILDARRWFAAEAGSYLRFQARILRQYCEERQWITTNHIHNFPAINPALNAGDFDLVSWTIYPVHGTNGPGKLGFRLGDPSALAFAADFMRNVNGRHGVMELQPGQVNWGVVNPQPLPGAVRLWIMQAFAAGARFVCTYRYRQPLSGAELYHQGLVGPDGVTVTRGGMEFSQAANDLGRLHGILQPGLAPPAWYVARRAAVLYSHESRWDLDHQPQTQSWDTYGHLLKYHRALKRVGAPVDVITEEKDFLAYPFLIAPAFQLLDEALVARWREYVHQGGHLILSCRTGQKDRRGHLWEAAWAAPIHELIGASITSYDTLPPPNVGLVKFVHCRREPENLALAGAPASDSRGPTETVPGEPVTAAVPQRPAAAGRADAYPWSSWAEVLAPRADAGVDVLATYANQYYAGGPAAITRSLGQGSVTYIGLDSLDGDLEARLVREVYSRARIAVESFAEGFLVDWRDGFWIATNATDQPQPAPIPAGATLLVGALSVPPAGVTLWTERSN